MICPSGVTRPIAGVDDSSANQTLPSVPAVRLVTAEPSLSPALNSLISPVVVIRPIACPVGVKIAAWSNQRAPSGPTTISNGEPWSSGGSGKRVTLPPGVIRPMPPPSKPKPPRS